MLGPASMIVTGMLIAEMSLKSNFTNWKDLFYYVFTSGGCSGDRIAVVKGQRTCKWQSGRKEDSADRISGSDHASASTVT